MQNIRNIILILPIVLLLTGCPPPGGADGEAGNPIITFLPFILIFVIFYFLILRPQQKQNKERKRMLSELKRGDDIITTGGLYGKILSVSEDDVITLEISKGVSIRITRAGIAGSQPTATETNSKEDKSK
ncbi:MAG: preprotein translocase subunit YajC [Thermodesulfobacteriota bacterium]